MHRFFSDELNEGELPSAILRGDELEHLKRVLRLAVGAEIEVVTPRGAYRARVSAIGASHAEAALTAPLPSREARCRITLYQCLPKADRMETVLIKGVELGVAAFVPVESERCVARVAARDAERKLERWRRIVCEAVKQSGRTSVPEVSAPVSWREAVARPAALKLLPWEEACNPEALRADDGSNAGAPLCSMGLRAALAQVPDEVAVFIGPEGGLTKDEVAQGARSGATIITLGPRILRTDTAGLAVCAAVLCASGDMGG